MHGCNLCPANSSTLNATGSKIAGCRCVPGYEGGHDPCSPDLEFNCLLCLDGKYKDSYSQDASSRCEDCPVGAATGKTGSTTVEDCSLVGFKCNPNSHQIGYTCPCDRGYWGNGADSVCTACPVDTFNSATGEEDVAACISCVTKDINTHTTKPGAGNSSMCICNSGYHRTSDTDNCTVAPTNITALIVSQTTNVQALNPAGSEALQVFMDSDRLSGRLGSKDVFESMQMTVGGVPCSAVRYLNDREFMCFTPHFSVASG